MTQRTGSDDRTPNAPAGAPPDCPACQQRPALTQEVLGKVLVFPCASCREAREREDRGRPEQHRREELARRNADITRYLAECGVNVREYGHCTFQGWEPGEDRHALSATRRWLDQDRGAWLYLYSRASDLGLATGNGKTHLAVAALREVLLRDDLPAPARDARFVNMAEFAWDLRDAVNSGRSVRDLVMTLCELEWLVVDDLGANRWTPFLKESLYVIGEKRMGRPTLWTSNYALDQLDAEAEDLTRFTSRVAGQGPVVELSGPDRRLSKHTRTENPDAP